MVDGAEGVTISRDGIPGLVDELMEALELDLVPLEVEPRLGGGARGAIQEKRAVIRDGRSKATQSIARK